MNQKFIGLEKYFLKNDFTLNIIIESKIVNKN